MTHGGDIYTYYEEFGHWPLDFSANVNPAGVPDSVLSALSEAAKEADVYPDLQCRALCAALAAHEQVAADCILCGNGAADLIWRYFLALRPTKALIVSPTFVEYEIALRHSGAEVKHFLLKEENDFSLDESIFSHLTKETELLFLCNPNNPNGKSIAPALLNKILAHCHEQDIRVFLDACFMGFLDERQSLSPSSLLADYPKLFILKAFTKLYGMAGVRLGYGLSSDTRLLEHMRAAGPPWPVSSLAQAAGLAALKDTNYLEESLRLVAEERSFLTNALPELGLKVYPSETNFLMFYTEHKTLVDAMRSQGILIRDCSNYQGLRAGFYRIAVHRRAENLMLLKALKQALQM